MKVVYWRGVHERMEKGLIITIAESSYDVLKCSNYAIKANYETEKFLVMMRCV